MSDDGLRFLINADSGSFDDEIGPLVANLTDLSNLNGGVAGDEDAALNPSEFDITFAGRSHSE
jgi:hypothetical protein